MNLSVISMEVKMKDGCSICGRLDGGTYAMHDGKIYCSRCDHNMEIVKCNKSKGEKVVEATKQVKARCV